MKDKDIPVEEHYYDHFYSTGEYAVRELKALTDEQKYLSNILEKYGAKKNKKCLEIGSGGGVLQDIVEDYVGLDLAESVRKYYHKPFIQGSATELLLEDDSFDIIWSIAALEHVPNPAKAFDEMIRVCKNGGHLLLAPAWHCRRWAAQGYQVRPYSDFGFWGKVYKFLIPVLDSIFIRGAFMFPLRVFGGVMYIIKGKEMPFIYTKLNPQYEVHRVSDDDACNSMDPFMAILYFEARGHKCVSHNTFWKKITSRHGFIDIEICKRQG